MVIGNNPQIRLSLFAPQYTMAAVLANEFTEAADDLYLSALIEIGLVLFAITLMVNMASRLLIWQMNRPVSGASRGARCRSAPRRREARHEARRRPPLDLDRRGRGCAACRCWSRWSRWPSSCSSWCRRACRR